MSAPILEDVDERLASVTIENLSFEKFIPRYDKAGALFYIAPHITPTKTTIEKGCSSVLILK